MKRCNIWIYVSYETLAILAIFLRVWQSKHYHSLLEEDKMCYLWHFLESDNSKYGKSITIHHNSIFNENNVQ